MQSEALFRYALITILLLALSISTYYRSRARRLTGTIPRRQEGWRLIVARLLSGLPLLLSILAYLIQPNWMRWSQVELPSAVRWTGALLGLLSLWLAIWVFRNLGANVTETTLTKADHQLITKGPYHYVRHPLYLMGFVACTSFSLLTANWFIALLVASFIQLFRWVIIPREEAALVAKFGEAYAHYRQTTGALWPRLRRLN